VMTYKDGLHELEEAEIDEYVAEIEAEKAAAEGCKEGCAKGELIQHKFRSCLLFHSISYYKHFFCCLDTG